MSSAAKIQAAKIASKSRPNAKIEGSAGERKTVKASRRGDRESAFAPAAHFVEADGDERPNERKAGGKRKRQMKSVPNDVIAKSAIPATA